MALTTYTIPATNPYSHSDNVIGVPDLTGVYTAGSLGAPGVTGLPSAVIQTQLGQLVQGWSKDATIGGMGEFIFLAVPTSTTVTPGLFYTWDGGYNIAVMGTSVANGVQSGFPIALAINTVASNASSIQYTYFQVQGLGYALRAPAAATVAAKVPLFVSGTTAGKVQCTASTLRTIIGIRSGVLATLATACSVLPVYLSGAPAVGPGK